MREGKPSFTATAVAAARAVTHVDAIAPRLVEGPLAWAVRAGRAGWVPALAMNAVTLGLLDHVEMRTRAIDAAVKDAVRAGVTQLVVLGAGLDARAWRMPELATVRVFEVDHPSTQDYKQSRIHTRVPSARDVTFVPVDFARDSLEEALTRAGQDADLATLWIWEGVTMYLPVDATRATLAAVAARSGPGSRIAVTYATPEATPLGTTVTRVALAAFRLIGETIHSFMTPEEMRQELATAGFRILDDSSAQQWADRYGQGVWPRIMLVEERLAVAVNGARTRGSRAA
jgi:methyltransferase (TIGR00027 family)